MINKKYRYALVGASNNPEKYGFKVFKNLLEKWYLVFPINPKEKEILGEVVFEDLISLKEKWNIDVVIFITPPPISLKILATVKELEIKKVWFQPWANDEACLEFCKKNNIEATHDACMMILG